VTANKQTVKQHNSAVAAALQQAQAEQTQKTDAPKPEADRKTTNVEDKPRHS